MVNGFFSYFDNEANIDNLLSIFRYINPAAIILIEDDFENFYQSLPERAKQRHDQQSFELLYEKEQSIATDIADYLDIPLYTLKSNEVNHVTNILNAFVRNFS